MRTPPTPPSTPSASKSASNATPASATGASKPRTTAKKALAKAPASEGSLVDKSVQKTTRKAAGRLKPDATSTFEKPAEADWHRMISETAYYRAERRGFVAGHEHDDWVWAEEEVRKILAP